MKPGVLGYLYRGGTFAGQLVETWYLVFTEKGLAEVEIQYVTRKNDSLRQFRSLLAELQKKYGMQSKEQDLRFLYLDLDANYENSSRKSGGREGPYWKALMYLDLYYSQILSQKSGQPAAVWTFDKGDKLKLCAPGRFRNQLVYTCVTMIAEADKAAKEKSNAQKDL